MNCRKVVRIVLVGALLSIPTHVPIPVAGYANGDDDEKTMKHMHRQTNYANGTMVKGQVEERDVAIESFE